MGAMRVVAALVLGPAAAIAVLACGDWQASGLRPRPAIAGVSEFRLMPVRYGAGRACPAARIGIPVKQLISKLDSSAIVIVHSEPGGVDIAIDTMRPTEEVMVCERRAAGNGEWAGIIYGGTRERCRMAPAPQSARAYAGPCRSGWVELDHIVGLDASAGE